MNKENRQGIKLLPPVCLLIYYRDNKVYNKHILTKRKTVIDEMQCVGSYKNVLNLLKYCVL
jgi:hypothetical protein